MGTKAACTVVLRILDGGRSMSNNPIGTIRKIQKNCRQATYLIEKRQHTKLTWKERVHLIIHLAGCSMCRLFRRQSRQINRLLHDIFRRPRGNSHSLDEKFKQELQDKINQKPSSWACRFSGRISDISPCGRYFFGFSISRNFNVGERPQRKAFNSK